jgi:hypothetical protein
MAAVFVAMSVTFVAMSAAFVAMSVTFVAMSAVFVATAVVRTRFASSAMAGESSLMSPSWPLEEIVVSKVALSWVSPVEAVPDSMAPVVSL